MAQFSLEVVYSNVKVTEQILSHVIIVSTKHPRYAGT